MSKLQQFHNYLYAQVGNPYLWGGTNTKLTRENYVAVCNKMEATTGNDYAATAVAFCRKRFDEGAEELRAFDCSGLMRYWAQINKGLYTGKTNADGFWRTCTETEHPVPGCWLFRFSDSSRTKATHIGYLTEKGVIHAKGRLFGVVLEDFEKTRSYWQAAGVPACFAAEIAAMTADAASAASDAGPQTETEEPEKYVLVKGDVRVRNGPGVLFGKIGTAHRGYRLPYMDTDYSTGWHRVQYLGKTGYISGKPKYTEVVEND